MFVGGTYFIDSAAASKNATEVVSGENAELAAIDSPEVVIEETGEEVICVGSGKYSNGKYTGGRTEEEQGLLASNPAHGYKIEPQGLKERDVGLALEERGDLGYYE